MCVAFLVPITTKQFNSNNLILRKKIFMYVKIKLHDIFEVIVVIKCKYMYHDNRYGIRNKIIHYTDVELSYILSNICVVLKNYRHVY